MYCPSCGNALAQELSYCNRCGANLSVIKAGGASNSLEKSAESTVWAIVAVTTSVPALMIPLLALMKGLALGGAFIFAFVALMSLVLLAVDAALIWQLLRFNKRAREIKVTSQSEGQETKELGVEREQGLFEPRMSVTENTTRTLEPTFEERRIK